MLKLKLQYFGHLMRRADSFEKTLTLGKIEGGRRSGQQRTRWLDGITNSMDKSLSKLRRVSDGQGSLVCCSPWGGKESDATEWLNWNNMNLGRQSDAIFNWQWIEQSRGKECIKVFVQLTMLICPIFLNSSKLHILKNKNLLSFNIFSATNSYPKLVT